MCAVIDVSKHLSNPSMDNAKQNFLFACKIFALRFETPTVLSQRF